MKHVFSILTEHTEVCSVTKALLSHFESSPSDAHSGTTHCGRTGNRNANPSTLVCLPVALSAAGKAPRPTQQHPTRSGNLFQNKHNCSKSPKKKRKKEIQLKILTLSQRRTTTEHVVFRCGFDVDLQFFFIGIRWEVLAIVVSKKMWWELPHILLVMVSILEGERKKKCNDTHGQGPKQNWAALE